jgi:hypothetical protein
MKNEMPNKQPVSNSWIRSATVTVAIVGTILQTAINVLPALLVLFALLSGWAILGWLLNANPYTAHFREFLIFLQGGMPWALALTILVVSIISVAPFLLPRWIARVRATYGTSLVEAETLAAGIQQRLQNLRQKNLKGK